MKKYQKHPFSNLTIAVESREEAVILAFRFKHIDWMREQMQAQANYWQDTINKIKKAKGKIAWQKKNK